MPTCHNQPPPSKPITYSFTPFKRLPTELRHYIWELARSGPRLIEVYPRPKARDEEGRVTSYKWRSTKCACILACYSPLSLHHHTSHEARLVASRTGKYSRAFGTWINRDIDILYIGERVGHLHNVGFLSEVAKEGGLKTLKALAVDDDVWDESRMRHSHERLSFKRL
jgi:hypothetical protein